VRGSDFGEEAKRGKMATVYMARKHEDTNDDGAALFQHG
jgi:hypothetical protein